MVTAACQLRSNIGNHVIGNHVIVEALRATIAKLVILYCGLVERHWDWCQSNHSGMLMTLYVIMVDLNSDLQQLLDVRRSSKMRCGAIVQNTCALADCIPHVGCAVTAPNLLTSTALYAGNPCCEKLFC